ncbi:MAG TPA: hypothetical protein VFN67_42935 [Polyangiales bacterium]|nr:hypothetical protein [Polyangiales bacterium]
MRQNQRFFLLGALILATAACPRLWAAWFDQGIFWPDEIFQSVEQAHRLAFGYGITPWEFRAGARSWVFPGMVAGVLELGAMLGLDSGQALMLLVKTTMALLSLGTMYMTMRLAHSLAGRNAALIAGLFAGFFPVSLLLAARSLSEVATAPVLLGSFMLSRRAGRQPLLLAGALSGLAICMRYQSGLIALGILAIVVSERRFKDAVWFAVGASALGLLGGMLDWLTWGKPFYALKKYLYFNLKKSGAKFGRYPISYYITVSWTAIGPAVLLLVAAFLAGLRAAPKLGLLVIGYVAVHSLIPHKEYRFLMPVVPMGLAIAACGLDALAKQLRLPTYFAPAAAVVCAVAMAFNTTQLTWAKLGFPSDRGDRSPWHSGEGINRLLWDAGERADVCGLMVTGESFGWTGGYSYFHRDANLYPDSSESTQRSANYLIAPAGDPVPDGYVEVASSRDSSLLKRPGGCAPAPDYRRELPY